jgi:hypothetical protein
MKTISLEAASALGTDNLLSIDWPLLVLHIYDDLFSWRNTDNQHSSPPPPPPTFMIKKGTTKSRQTDLRHCSIPEPVILSTKDPEKSRCGLHAPHQWKYIFGKEYLKVIRDAVQLPEDTIAWYSQNSKHTDLMKAPDVATLVTRNHLTHDLKLSWRRTSMLSCRV